MIKKNIDVTKYKTGKVLLNPDNDSTNNVSDISSSLSEIVKLLHSKNFSLLYDMTHMEHSQLNGNDVNILNTLKSIEKDIKSLINYNNKKTDSLDARFQVFTDSKYDINEQTAFSLSSLAQMPQFGIPISDKLKSCLKTLKGKYLEIKGAPRTKSSETCVCYVNDIAFMDMDFTLNLKTSIAVINNEVYPQYDVLLHIQSIINNDIEVNFISDKKFFDIMRKVIEGW